MKRKSIAFTLLVGLMLTLSSCLNSDDDDVTSYDDTAITAFTLGTQKYIAHTTATDGSDSTYQTTLDCSSRRFYIDQANRVIYNPDSLPRGLDATKIVCTISAKNNGMILLKAIDSDSLTYYSSADSIDFSVPREVRVYAYTADTHYRAYTVKVNIHKELSNAFAWQPTGFSAPALTAMSGMKAVALGGRVFVFGNVDGRTLSYSALASAPTVWTADAATRQLDGEAWRSVVAHGGYLYTLSGDSLLRSADASEWTTVAPADGIEQIMGASSLHLFALTSAHKLVASADGGATWTAESVAGDESSLPQGNVSLTVSAVEADAQMERLTLVGYNAATTGALVWSKLEDASPYAEQQSWMLLDYGAGNKYKLPDTGPVATATYNNKVLAFDGTQFYSSADGGITWPADTTVSMPAGADGGTAFAMTATADGYVWLATNTAGDCQIWFGRHNSVAWKNN